MQFTLLTALTAALSVSQVQAQMSAKDIVNNIEEITSLSKDANDIAMDLDNPATLIPNGVKLVNDFKGIITTVTKDISAMGDSEGGDIDKSGQSDICDAFRTFVEVHQELLKTVIGKSGLLSGTPLTAPIAAVLRTLEGGVDKLAFGIIAYVPTCADKAQSDLKKLDMTLESAVTKYSS